MIQIVQGFKLATRDAVDNRLLLSKAEMRTINDNQMPEKYFAICKDDGKLYLYDKSRELDPSEEGTGKFELFSSAVIDSISVNGRVLPVNLGNVDLPLATAEQYGMVLPGKGLKVDDGDGYLTLDFNSLDDGAIPFSKIDWEGAVIDGNNILIN